MGGTLLERTFEPSTKVLKAYIKGRVLFVISILFSSWTAYFIDKYLYFLSTRIRGFVALIRWSTNKQIFYIFKWSGPDYPSTLHWFMRSTGARQMHQCCYRAPYSAERSPNKKDSVSRNSSAFAQAQVTYKWLFTCKWSAYLLILTPSFGSRRIR